MSADSTVGLPPAQHVIQSKLRIPSLPERFDERPRVEKLLAHFMTHKRAVVVTAAAGSGKTTAVAGAARRVRAPVAWLAVDRPDAAPGRLVTYLDAAIARLVPNASGVATSAVAAGIPHAEAAGLLAEAIGPTPLVLVLDELERIGQEPEPWRIIESLLRWEFNGRTGRFRLRGNAPKAVKHSRNGAGGGRSRRAGTESLTR